MQRRTVCVAAGVALLALAGAVPARTAGQSAPRFRAGVDLLTIEVAAVDKQDAPVTDLTADDFVVTIGGATRKVVFAQHRRGEGAGGGVTITTGAATPSPAPLPASLADGRIVMFVVDRDSLERQSERVLLEAATTVLDKLGPNDAAGLLGIPVGGVPLTREHDRVRAALPLMAGTRPMRPAYRDWNISWDEALAYERRDTRVIAEVIERECYRMKRPEPFRANTCPDLLSFAAMEWLLDGRSHVQTTIPVLEGLADQLAPLRGSKHIVFISGGLPFGMDLLSYFDRFSGKAARAGVMLHAIHLDAPPGDVADRRVVASAFGGRDFASGLNVLSAATGGAFFLGAGRATGVFDRISTTINDSYILGLESGPEDVTTETRPLAVTVRRPDVSVRARREVAPPAAVPAAATADVLKSLLDQPTDLRDLPLSVETYTTRGVESAMLRALIASELGPDRVTLPAEWGFAVLSDGNVVATGRDRVEGSAGERATVAVAAKLVPGRYRLRVAAVDAGGRAGVVDVPLSVGLRVAGSLQMSDLIVGIANSGRLDPRGRIPQGSRVSALIEVMSSDAGQLERARTTIDVIPEGSSEPVRKYQMAARTGASDAIAIHSAEIDNGTLPAGRYTASAVVVLDGEPVGRVSRSFEVR